MRHIPVAASTTILTPPRSETRVIAQNTSATGGPDVFGAATSNIATFRVTIAAAVSNAVISGTVFNDANGDKKFDDGELGLGGYVVFIDLKGTGVFATGDPTATTSVNGAWSFTGLAARAYKIAIEPVAGASLTTPMVLTITVSSSATSSRNLFGEKAIS